MLTNTMKFFCILSILMFALGRVNSAPCKALVLEAGGDKGAYQAGALRGLFEELGHQEIDYDVIAGVSVGAINAAAFSIYPPGEEDEATQWLLEFWRGITRQNVFTHWDYSVFEGIFYQKGLFNNSVFIDYWMEAFEKYHNGTAPKKEIYRKVTVGATDLKSGEFIRFNEDLSFEDFAYKAVRASASLPGLFPAVDFQNMTLVDGGVDNYLDVGGAIDWCKEIADSDEEITIDIIMCHGNQLSEVDTSDFNTIDVFLRYREINKYRDSMKWVNDALMNFPRVNFRYLVVPQKPLDNAWLPIHFEKKHTEGLIEKGLMDAKETIRAGEFTQFMNSLNSLPNTLKFST